MADLQTSARAVSSEALLPYAVGADPAFHLFLSGRPLFHLFSFCPGLWRRFRESALAHKPDPDRFRRICDVPVLAARFPALHVFILYSIESDFMVLGSFKSSPNAKALVITTQYDKNGIKYFISLTANQLNQLIQ